MKSIKESGVTVCLFVCLTKLEKIIIIIIIIIKHKQKSKINNMVLHNIHLSKGIQYGLV